MLLENGTRLSSPQQIHMEAVRYFEKFLTEEHMGTVPNLSSLIDNTVTQAEGQYLCAPMDSSLWSNGFGSCFFMKCWDIVKKEVIEAAQDFFLEDESLLDFTQLLILSSSPRSRNQLGLINSDLLVCALWSIRFFQKSWCREWLPYFQELY